MSQRSNFILGALAAVATLGAVQLAAGQAASGPNLAERFQALASPRPAGAAGINRVAKGDREANPAQAGAPARTVMVRVDSLADTSVLIRIPVQNEARNVPKVPAAMRPVERKGKMAVACEPPVSMLTEVAKLLKPGRCIT
jgi:hypothetical protein